MSFFFFFLFNLKFSLASCGSTVDQESAIDLRASGKSMDGIPILEQDGLGYCYSYVASTLVSAYIRSKTPGLTSEEKDMLLISPFVMGLLGSAMGMDASVEEFNRTGILKDFDSNQVCIIANLIKEQGACSLNDVTFLNGGEVRPIDRCVLPSTEGLVRWHSDGPHLDFFKDLQKFNAAVLSLTSGKKETESKESLNVYLNDIRKHWNATEIRRKSSKGWPSSTQEHLDGLLRQLPKMHSRGEHFEVGSDSGTKVEPELFPRVGIAILAPACLKVEPTGKVAFQGHFKLGSPLNPVEGSGGTKIANFKKCNEIRVFPDNKNMIKGSQLIRFEPPPLLEKKLNEIMDLNDQPIGISFCWSFLLEGAAESKYWTSVNASTPNKFPDKSEDKFNFTPNGCRFKGVAQADHKALVIGRRLHNGRCEYLLRNSWGNECAMYVGEYKKSCEEELRTNRYADVWVSGDLLTSSMGGYHYLE